MEKATLHHAVRPPRVDRTRLLIAPFIASFLIFAFHSTVYTVQHLSRQHTLITPEFSSLASHCSHLSPIGPTEFHSRQLSLARALHTLDVTAFVAEPSSNALFFANISTSNWYLSERPLLLVFSPVLTEQGELQSKLTILTPHFEADRAKLLHVPADVTFVEWAEEENPYEVLRKTLGDGASVIVDENMRHFIATGLQDTGLDVRAYPSQIRHLREQKSEAELELLRCANEVTVLAIRATREHMYIGMRESEAHTLIKSALAAAGLTHGDALVLFGENAALPHGSGTDRVLGVHDLALFDVGGKLHGYTSDITRTFALPKSEIPSRHLELFKVVQNAQLAAHNAATKGTLAKDVDQAARSVVQESALGGKEGLGKYFTHRLGHGIGLDGHESPYLRGGNDVELANNNTFSNEPGIYILFDVGIRLEDCFYVDTYTGAAKLLTSGVGGFAKGAWDP